MSAISVIAVMLAGVLASVLGTCIAIWARRSEMTPGALFWAGSDVAAHPERYVKPGVLGTVRVVYLVAAALLVTGALTLVYHALASFR